MKQKEQINLEGLRQDGRRFNELRRVAFSMGMTFEVNYI